MYRTNIWHILAPGRLGIAVLAMLTVLSMLALVRPGQSQAQTTNTWSSAAGITPSSIDALDPQIVIDQAGVSHVVYFETNFSSRERVYYINNRSGSWSTPRLMSEAAN
ncbi:MAG: hypothetical protein HC876_21315, partial [Chloroflexaceae bacterium]|nr:hypothetical protein [Chloroflexaceae bacterium]